MSISRTSQNIQALVRSSKKGLLLKRLKDPETAKKVKNSEIKEALDLPNIPTKVYLDTLMTVLSHAKEKYSSGSYAAFLKKSILALNENKKLILDSGINFCEIKPCHV